MIYEFGHNEEATVTDNIKDNREEMRKNREVKEIQKGTACRVCGCISHFQEYNSPSMECIEYLRSRISAYEWDKFPDRMGK